MYTFRTLNKIPQFDKGLASNSSPIFFAISDAEIYNLCVRKKKGYIRIYKKNLF